MSSLLVPVAEIEDVKPHPNADRLELAIIGGWQVIVGKGNYKPGVRVVYVPPDAIIEPRWSDRWGVTQYLSNGRVRTAKLRGEPSFGFTVPITDLPAGGELHEVGENVAAVFGITKYDPYVKTEREKTLSYDSLPNHPMLLKYTDVENLRHYPLVIPEGEEVVMTEKIHGTNARIACIDGEVMIGSRNQRKLIPEDLSSSWFSHPLENPGVKGLLTKLGESHKQVILYGEVFGKVQKLQYGVDRLAFRAFDLMIDGKYQDWDDVVDICTTYGIPMVPVLYRGPFTLSQAQLLSNGPTTIGGGHTREGVVVHPVTERRDPKLGRVILKFVGSDYLTSGKDDDLDAEVA